MGVFQNFPNLSIFENILNSLKPSDTFKEVITQRPAIEKTQFLDLLHREKKMGYRGHEEWDKIAFFLIFAFIFLGVFVTLLPVIRNLSIQHHIIVSFVLAIVCGYVGERMLCYLFRKYTDIQKNPKPEDLPNIFSSIIRKEID